ncbi:hypothetical protein BDR06DRAFT_366667 [Suillus hirtellus]|nr:hypothetical protein BDR06DRAFT_366667 [Suillus hirtellus]
MQTSIYQDWGAIALGSLDVPQAIRNVACSSNNLTSRGMYPSLHAWHAADICIRDRFTQICVEIQDVLPGHNNQIMGPRPCPILDSSMLALGNRAGSITFLRCLYARGAGSTKTIREVPSSIYNCRVTTGSRIRGPPTCEL